MGFLKIFLSIVFICNNNVMGEIREEAAEPKIVSGVTVKIEDYPYQAALIKRLTNKYLCGGSIISSEYILTTANCIRDTTNELVARLGSNNYDVGGEIFDVKEFISHPEYNIETNENDIGLLHLSSPIDSWSGTIQQIKLPNANDADPEPGTTAVVAGWGGVYLAKSTNLEAADVKIIPLSTCQEKFKIYEIVIDERIFCTGETEESPYHGDDGGALVVDGVQYGVMSYPTSQRPFYYAHVSVVAFRQFIIDQVGEDQLKFHE